MGLTAVTILFAAVLLSCSFTALRATKVDPWAAIRSE
jgi:ABC-type antimicrobial peptide transport system permease subunit